MSTDGELPFTGVVLAGGHSSRLGQDKALLAVNGRAMAATVAIALRDAGADEVVAVGGDSVALERLGVFDRVIDDVHPGEGPLGGLLTAFSACATPVVVVLACDTPEVTAATPRALADAIESVDVAVGFVGSREQPLTAAWRCATVAPIASALFRAGERAPRTLLGLVRCRRVPLAPSAVTDVDRPEDLARYAPGADRTTDREDSAERVGVPRQTHDDRSTP